MYFRNW